MAVEDIAEASNLWIEAGEMSGPPDHRHQIEFSAELARFFLDRDEGIVLVRLKNGGAWECHMSHRGERYGQWADIWRLGLPRRRRGAPEYAGQVIGFERKRAGASLVYEITVVPVGSREARQWQDLARTHGKQGTTGGAAGREYGYW